MIIIQRVTQPSTADLYLSWSTP